MKKILFLLLFTSAMYGQIVPTGQEQDFDYGIKNTASQLDDNALFITVQNSDGVQGKSTSSVWAKKIYVDNADVKKAFLSTGLIKNGLVQANADPTKFNITAGIGIISNFDDPENPTSTIVNFPAFTGITPTYLTTSNITYIAINSSATIVQQATPFTNIQRRDLIALGAVIHSNLTTINLINNISAPTNAGTNQLHDLMEAIGALNVDGNKITANGANLSINKTAGDIFKLGVNFANDWKNPHKLNISAQTPVTFRYRTQNGTEGSNVTALNPALYDVANVLTSVPSNKFSIQTVTLFQTGAIRVQYGQATYATLSEAESAINTRTYNVEPNIAANGITRAYIILKNTATSLQNASDTKIVEAGKFGNVGGSGGAITLDAIVAALGYTPANDVDVVHKIGDETKSGKLNLSNSNLLYVEEPIFSGLSTSGAGVLSGTYYYSITYYSQLGETASSGSQSIVTSSNQVAVSLPVSPNPNVIGRKIYRSLANPAFQHVIKYLAADIPNNTDTSYTDDTPDISLGVLMPWINTTGGQLFLNGNRIGFAGSLSTSFGFNSALNNTGYANTGFGYGVLTANTSGHRNTGLGTFALYENTTGYNNTAVGVHALNYNINGVRNSALGFASLISNVGGSYNSALGHSSLESNVSGSYNVAVGDSALQMNTASSNTAIGMSSLPNNSNGSGNVSIGTSSMTLNSSGNFNTSIGNLAGYNSTGNNNVFLGYSSGYFETASNKLFIDNSQRANETDARTKSLIYGIFDANPSNQFLTINGNLNIGLIPTTSAATYDILTRNSSTGVVEKITSNILTGTGTSGYLSKFTSSNTIGNGVIYDNGTNIGIGTSTVPAKLTVEGDFFINNTSNVPTAYFNTNGAGALLSLNKNYSNLMQVDNFGNITATSFGGSATLTGTPTAPTAISGTNTTQIATTAFVQASRPYKVYTALLSQSGTSAPTATVLENTLGGTIVWIRVNPGLYSGTLTGTFTADKTILLNNNPVGGVFTNIFSSVNTITIQTRNSSNAQTDDGLSNTSIEIRVYN